MRAGLSILLITNLLLLLDCSFAHAQSSDTKSSSSQGNGSASTKNTGNNSDFSSNTNPNQGNDSNQPKSSSNLPYSSSKRDPIAEKYGATAASIKRLDPLMNDAQGILSNTEYTYFQNKLSSLKESAASDVEEGIQRGTSFVGPMKSLESELANSIEQAKQTNSQNKLKLDDALQHMHATFDDRKGSLSSKDQERFIDMMDELESRARSVSSSFETANRMSSLSEEVANLEASIVGKTLFSTYSPDRNDQDPRTEKRSSIRVLPDKQKETDDDPPPPIPIPATRLVDPPKPALAQIAEKVGTQIKQLVARGILGSIDEEQFQRRLSLQKNLMPATPAAPGKQQQLSLAQEEIIRKELEQLLIELSDRAAGR